MTLLRNARTDDNPGPITKVVTPEGIWIACEAFTFGSDGDDLEDDRWGRALEWLLDRGLLEFIGTNAAGAQYVATLMGLAFLNDQESSRHGQAGHDA